MTALSNVFLKDTELQVRETAGFITQHILRTGSLVDPVTITYGVTGNTATIGQDFVGGVGTITMAAGVSDASVKVQILDDGLAEPTEVGVFSLIDVQGATLWAPRTSRISILDNETPLPPPASEPSPVSDYEVSMVPVATGLDQPIKFVFSPVDPLIAYVGQKNGVIEAVNVKTGTTKVVLDIQREVNSYGDRGLMGIALHPDFAENPYIYVFAVIDPPDASGKTGNAGLDGGGNRYAQVIRYTADEATGFTTVVPGSGLVLAGAGGQSLNDINGGGHKDFTDPAFASEISSDRYVNPARPAPTLINGFKQDYLKDDAASHIGGAMAFGPDGKLYISVGDGTSFNFADPRAPNVQLLDSLSGKIMRIDPMTGQGLADNPFVQADTSLNSNRAKIYQLGLRNPFSMTFDVEGRLFIANTGWDSYEAINMGGPGANFGWPFYEGGDGGVPLQTPSFRNFPAARAFYAGVADGSMHVTPSFRAFSHNTADPGYQVQAITGGAVVYTGNAYPTEFQNDYFFSDFSGGEIYTADANDRASLKFLYKGAPSDVPLDYVQGPDGYVYYSNIGTGEIGRMLITALPPPLPPGSATVGSGADALVLKVSQDAYDGNAQYAIRVDGTRIGGNMTALAAHGSGQSDTVTVLGNWATGHHTVTVEFLNDAFGWDGADRNLYVDGASYNGVAVADAGRALMSNGSAAIGLTDVPTSPATGNSTIGAGPDTLVLRISQDLYNGPAQYTVSIDGQQIGGTLTATALHGSGQSNTISVLGNWAPGPHTATVTFLNDLYAGTAATDRNLYVDGTTYNGVAVTGGVRALLGSGSKTIGFAEAPASPATGDSTIGTGSDTLVLRISQDLYSGPAQYTVSIDGRQVGGTLTATALHGSGVSDIITVLGDWTPGTHTVAVNFLNDGWGGTAATDRNLYVDGATYDGTTVPGSALTLLTSGPQSMAFLDKTAIPASVATIGSGPNALVLNMSQDAYDGSAQYVVRVDGVQVGGTLTATALRGSGVSDTITVLGTWGMGEHTATIDFLNDAWDGTAETDRNLYLDSATLNGATMPNSSLPLFVPGPVNISFIS